MDINEDIKNHKAFLKLLRRSKSGLMKFGMEVYSDVLEDALDESITTTEAHIKDLEIEYKEMLKESSLDE